MFFFFHFGVWSLAALNSTFGCETKSFVAHRRYHRFQWPTSVSFRSDFVLTFSFVSIHLFGLYMKHFIIYICVRKSQQCCALDEVFGAHEQKKLRRTKLHKIQNKVAEENLVLSDKIHIHRSNPVKINQKVISNTYTKSVEPTGVDFAFFSSAPNSHC